MKKDKLSRSHQLILETLNAENALTYEDIAEITGLSYDGVRGRISELGKMGYDIDKIKDSGNTFLMYKKGSSYKRPDQIKNGISKKLKAVDDFYGMTDFLDSIKNSKVKKVKKLPQTLPEETNAILLLSDLHFGELIFSPDGKRNVFNTDVATERMEQISADVPAMLMDYGIDHLHILGLGDMVDGDMIYRNHLFRVEKPAIEQVQDTVKAISAMIREIVDNDITVEMHNVRGNHGITNYNNLEEDNWDNVVYDMLEIVFEENPDVVINNYKSSEAVVRIGNKNIVIYHGNNFGAQIKTASGLREFRGMCGKHKLNDGDMIVVGHLHEFGIESDQGKLLIRNGSLADASEYALKLNLYSAPMQTLMLIEDDMEYPMIFPISLV